MVDFKKARTKLAENRAAALKEQEYELRAAWEELFKNFPNLSVIEWTQYAPYFNDGEACIFHVHEVYGTSYSKDQLQDISGLEDLYDEDPINADESLNEALTELYRLHGECEDTLAMLFGDSSRIRIYRDMTVEVEEEDHD